MDWEYVALQYGGEKGTSSENALFDMWYNKLFDEGWREFVRAPWRLVMLQGKGGVCIMRRPKGKPELKLEPVYEYVAVLNEDEAKGQWDALKERGWMQARCVRLSGRRGHIHLMRRIDPTVVIAEVESKDEPRLWTETEIQEIAQRVLTTFVNLSAI